MKVEVRSPYGQNSFWSIWQKFAEKMGNEPIDHLNNFFFQIMLMRRPGYHKVKISFGPNDFFFLLGHRQGLVMIRLNFIFERMP